MKHESEAHSNFLVLLLFKKNLNASKPEHPLSGENLSKYLGGNIGCRDKIFTIRATRSI